MEKVSEPCERHPSRSPGPAVGVGGRGLAVGVGGRGPAVGVGGRGPAAGVREGVALPWASGGVALLWASGRAWPCRGVRGRGPAPSSLEHSRHSSRTEGCFPVHFPTRPPSQAGLAWPPRARGLILTAATRLGFQL